MPPPALVPPGSGILVPPPPRPPPPSPPPPPLESSRIRLVSNLAFGLKRMDRLLRRARDRAALS